MKPFAAACVALGMLGCSPSASDEPRERLPAAPPAEPVEPLFDVSATAISAHQVRFEVMTNIPPPIQVMAGVSLADQDDDDVYIGYTERVTLTEPTSAFVLDTSKASKPLPAATYEAEVSFYPRWGADGNAAAKSFPDMEDMELVELKASGASRTEAVRRRELQKWVMLNVTANVPWDEAAYVAQLGKYQKSQADLSRLHDAYYFPDADMTLIVNRLRNEISLWREGRESR